MNVLLLMVSTIPCQEPGQLGFYQGFKLIPGQMAQTIKGKQYVPEHWAVAALFSYHPDAEKWYEDNNDGLVVDSRGALVFAPKKIPLTDAPFPMPQKAAPALNPIGPMVKVHGRTPPKQWVAAVMPSALHSRTVIPNGLKLRPLETTDAIRGH